MEEADMDRLTTYREMAHNGRLVVSYLALSMLCFQLNVHAQSRETLQGRTHKVFGLKGSFDHPVHLPQGVLKALVATKETAYLRDKLKENPHLDVSQFFVAKEVHLSSPNETDYVVLGQFALTGADCDWFWVVRSIKPTPRVVHFGIGTTLEILDRKKSEELPEIRMDYWAGSGYGWAEEYGFNGSRYVRSRRLDTYWEFKQATPHSRSSWVLQESHLSRSVATP
jgi:hypothetical protein